ncbi:MAG: alpha-glucosidase [Lachnospiraceae bacterium]|nr:alpha-glucosidase [Lachnospiraceae bacterium]
MIRKYKLGEPIDTESTVQDIAISSDIPKGFVMDSECVFRIDMSEDTRVYGLGETVRGINKRGWRYISNCTDDPIHTESKNSLYAAHNFLLIWNKKNVVGYYVDTPEKAEFDIGYSDPDRLFIRLNSPNAYFYEITPDLTRTESKACETDNPLTKVVQQFRHLIGQSYIPPLFAFGYGQSRWGYKSREDILSVIQSYEDADIPLDSVYLDIDYMDSFKDFTINEDSYPDFEDFVKSVSEKNIHLIPIIDAGIKIEDGYDVYEEGIKEDHFCKKEDGTPFVAAVWPGRVHFPDFFRPETRKWFGEKYSFLLNKGIDGFWNDMNEPAIFYSEDGLDEAFDKIHSLEGQNLDISSFFEFVDTVESVKNSPKDYESFYHEYKGQKIRHDKLHNLYGYMMTRAAGEAFEKLCPDRRILMFSRASYIGMHRYGGVWTGDNQSWWSHLLLNIQQLPGLNMCGFLYSGADTGGFGADCTEDLLLRWLAVGIFTPLFRNHSAMGTRQQEVYRFPHKDWMRGIIRLRYALIPYLYSEFMKAASCDDMFIRPLSFVYMDDERACDTEDQLFVGKSIMIAPVYTQNAAGRTVYLPEPMKMLRFDGDRLTEEADLTAGDHYIPISLKEVVVFLRKGYVLPLGKPARTTAELDLNDLTYIQFD